MMPNWIDNNFFIGAKNVFQLGVFNQKLCQVDNL